MAFPTISTLLDDFNRASLGAAWTQGIYSGEQLQIFTSDRLTNISGWGSASFNTATYGPDIELQAVIDAAGTFEIAWKLTNVATASPNGYFIHYEHSGTNSIQLWKMTLGTQASIGATQAVTFNGGDTIGVEQIGSTINVYRKAVGSGTWTLVMSRTDSSYTSTIGRFGFLINGAHLDDMIGGTVSSGPNLTQISIPATLTATAALSDIVMRPRAMPVGLTLTTVINRRLFRPLAAGATLTAALTKFQIRPRALSAGITFTLAIVRGKARAVPVTVTLTPALTRIGKDFITLPGAVTLTAALNRKLNRTLAATLIATPAISGLQKLYKTIAASLVVGQAISFAKSKFLTLPATMTMGIALSRAAKYYKTLAATVTPTAAIARKQMLNKTLAANVTMTAQTQLIRMGRISLAGNLPLTGLVVNRGNKLLNSVVSFAGAIQVQKISGGAILKTLAAGLQLQSGLVASKVIKKTLTGALFLDSIIQRRKLSPTDWQENDWLIDAKSLDTPHLDGARLEEAVLERTTL